MKKITFVFLLQIFMISAFAQHRVQWEYCELSGQGLFFVKMNTGQEIKTYGDYRIKDEAGEAIRFNSMVDALNYMGRQGWELVDVYQSSGEISFRYYLMKRQLLEDDSESDTPSESTESENNNENNTDAE